MVFALVEVACRVVMNPEKAALYFCLAFLGGFLISVTVMCGSWMALKLAPVANDRTSMYSHRSTMTHTSPPPSKRNLAQSTSRSMVDHPISAISHQSIMTQTSDHSSEDGRPPSIRNPSYRLSFLEELRNAQSKGIELDKQSKCSEKVGGGRNSSGNPFSEDEEMGYDEEDEEDDEGQADSGKGPSVFGGSSITCGGRTAGSGPPPDTHRSPSAGNPTSVGGATVKPTASSGRSPGQHSHNVGRPDYPPLGRGNTLPMNGVNNYAELAYDEEEDTYDDDYEDYDQYYTSNGHHVPLENRHTKRVSVEYHQDQADSRWRQQQRQPGCPGPGHRHQLSTNDIDRHIGLRHDMVSNNGIPNHHRSPSANSGGQHNRRRRYSWVFIRETLV